MFIANLVAQVSVALWRSRVGVRRAMLDIDMIATGNNLYIVTASENAVCNRIQLHGKY